MSSFKSKVFGILLALTSLAAAQDIENSRNEKIQVRSRIEISKNQLNTLDCHCNYTSPDGRYFADPKIDREKDLHYIVLRDRKKSKEKVIFEAKGINHPCFSWDGRKVYFGAKLPRKGGYQKDIMVYDMDGKVSNVTNTNDSDEYGFDVSKNGKKILFDMDNKIGIMNSNGSGKKILLEPGEFKYFSPIWNCDNTGFVCYGLSGETLKYFSVGLGIRE